MRVGMVRWYSTNLLSWVSFPHACGDGPNFQTFFVSGVEFSPCVWGWSAIRKAPTTIWNVFPMRVGMVRRPTASFRTGERFPHACGDGPFVF